MKVPFTFFATRRPAASYTYSITVASGSVTLVSWPSAS
jgi:hypothetical protein